MTKQRAKSLPVVALVLILATPVASWWLVGDLSEEVAEGVELDYGIPPLSLDPLGDGVVGVLACIAAIRALALLVSATSSRRLDSRWWLVLLPLVGAGVLVGFAWRVLTAGVIGANIGGGLTIIFGGPLLGVLLIAAAAAALQIRWSRVRRNGSNSA
ncbi:hypothetical protein GCM10023176_22820 [Micromonospora coerulea]|uniref:Uncharacterized protein n=1 Tax=Micromonospora coerulea TaxID=47856 RepID=A0ABP8SIZ5_9ACTN